MHPEKSAPAPTPGRKEREKPAELLEAANTGLQARFLLGELSNPQVEINKFFFRPIKDAGAKGITEQVGNKYQRASLTQRKRHQQETGLTLSQWRDGFDAYLQEVRQDTNHSERKEFLETLEIMDTFHAEDFYDEYLRGKSDIIKFVDAVEIRVTREQIQQHEDIIRQLGNAFGYESSAVIDHLIHGVRNVKDDIDSFTKRAGKQVNKTDVLHNPLLSRIEEDGHEEEVKKVPKKAVPAKTGSAKAEPAMAVRPFRATPIRRVDLDAEPEAGPPARKEGPKKKAVGQVQVYPAPVREEKRSEEHLMTNDELAAAAELLSDDGNRLDQERQVTLLRESDITNHYARELHAMMVEYGRDFVFERAENAVQRLQSTIEKLGLKRDKLSKSESWYLLGIAKARFLAKNVDQQIRPTVEAYDPLLHYRIGTDSSEGQKSYAAEESIINDMLGWEVYRQRKKSLIILSHLDPLTPSRDKTKLQILFAKPPNDESETLSGSQLREIGRLVRKYIPRR